MLLLVNLANTYTDIDNVGLLLVIEYFYIVMLNTPLLSKGHITVTWVLIAYFYVFLPFDWNEIHFLG